MYVAAAAAARRCRTPLPCIWKRPLTDTNYKPSYTQPTNANPNQPNARWWNMVQVGHVPIGHVNFLLFVSFLFALSTQHERGFWWNMGLNIQSIFLTSQFNIVLQVNHTPPIPLSIAVSMSQQQQYLNSG